MSGIRFLVDVEDNAGNRLGSGPITTAQGWQQPIALDRLGSFSFSLPASDPQLSLIQPRRVVRARRGTRVLGAGVIDSITIDDSGDVPRVTVAGMDLGQELTWKSVGYLELMDDGWVKPVGAFQIKISPDTGQEINGSYVDSSAAVDENPATGSGWNGGDTNWYWLYIGAGQPFNRLKFDIANPGGHLGLGWRCQYYDGYGWVDLAITDTTNWWQQDGEMSFALPANWQSSTQGSTAGYWVRIQPNAWTVTELREISVWGKVPTPSALQKIAAKLPAGWSLDTVNGYGSTLKPDVYALLDGESVLQALIKLSELTGEHFYVTPERKVVWLRKDLPVQPFRLTNQARDATKSDPSVGVIASFTETRETYDTITRVYPVGAGVGLGRLTLAYSSKAVPAGYVVDRLGNYVKKVPEDDSLSIQRQVPFKEIGPRTMDYVARRYAANQLLDAAVVHLARHCQEALSWDVSVVGLGRVVYPGSKVRVEYRRVVGGVVVKSLNQDLIVLQSTVSLGENGLETSDFVLSTIDAWPTTDEELLARLLKQSLAMGNYPQPVEVGQVNSADVSTAGLALTVGNGGLAFTGNPGATASPGSGGGTIPNPHNLIGANHYVTGLTAGQYLRAATATSAIFDTIKDADIPASIARLADLAAHAALPAAHHDPVTAGDGIAVNGQQVAVNSSVVRTSRKVLDGAHLTGGGDLSADRTLDVDLAADFTWTGQHDWAQMLRHRSGLQLLDKAGTGWLTWAARNTSGAQAVLDLANLGSIAGQSLGISGAATVGQDLTAAGAAFRVISHEGHSHVVVNPTAGWSLDEQFGLDVDDNLLVRGWIVGKHAIQLSDALLIAHFDGPKPYETDFTGDPTGHLGQVPTITGGAIYRPGKFGKGIQVAEATTNYIGNPRAANDLGWWLLVDAGVTRVTGLTSAPYGTTAIKFTKSATYEDLITPQIACGENQAWTASFYYSLDDGATWTLWSNTYTTQAGATWIVFHPYLNSTGGFSIRVDTNIAQLPGVQVATVLNAIQITAIQFEPKPYRTPYCDGSLGLRPGQAATDSANGTYVGGHCWSGAPHASTSSRQESSAIYGPLSGLGSEVTVSFWAVQLTNPGTASGCIYLTLRKDANNAINFIHWNGIDTHLGAELFIGGARRVIDSFDASLFSGVHHHTITLKPTSLEWYIDGIPCPPQVGTYDVSWLKDASLSVNGTWLLDELAVFSRALSADEIRAIYESQAPVFAETSTWSTRAAKNLFSTDEQGVWMYDTAGKAVLGISGIDGKSWGGSTLNSGDIQFGVYGSGEGGWLKWDRDGVGSKGFLSLGYGLNEILAADKDGVRMAGVLGIGLDGGIYQGSGTFAAPTTGLKVWSEGGIGRIGGFRDGDPQWSADTDGAIRAGGGGVTLDADGIGLEVGSNMAGADRQSINFRWTDDSINAQIQAIGNEFITQLLIRTLSRASAQSSLVLQGIGPGSGWAGSVFVGAHSNFNSATISLRASDTLSADRYIDMSIDGVSKLKIDSIGDVYLGGRIAGSQYTGARVGKTTPTTCTNNNYTIITFDTSIWDGGLSHWGGGSAVYAHVAGWYLVGASVALSGVVPSNARVAPCIRVNGVADNIVVYGENTIPSGQTGGASCNGVCYLNAGDYIQLALYTSASSALTVLGNSGNSKHHCSMWMARIA
jgi:hypothetical protein